MHTMRTMGTAPRRGVRLLAPLLLAVAMVTPSHASAATATAHISDVLVVESAICDEANAHGHFQASAAQVDILGHGATSACVVIHTDATASDTLSISTMDANNMSVYSRGPIKSQAPAGSTAYYLLSPHMTYQNGANAAWPDGIYTTSVIIDGAGARTATWAVGVPLPSPTPPLASEVPAPAATPGGSGTPSAGKGIPTAAGTPAAALYHARPDAPYAMRPPGGQGMHGPLTGAALDAQGDALLYADRSTYDGATKGYVNDYHIYLLSAAGQVRELPLPDGVTDLVPKAMNDRGEVVGYSYANSQGFVYRSGA